MSYSFFTDESTIFLLSSLCLFNTTQALPLAITRFFCLRLNNLPSIFLLNFKPANKPLKVAFGTPNLSPQTCFLHLFYIRAFRQHRLLPMQFRSLRKLQKEKNSTILFESLFPAPDMFLDFFLS